MTPQEMLQAQGRDEKAEVARLNRRLTYRARNGDRLKVFARGCDWLAYYANASQLKKVLDTLRKASGTQDTAAYVQAWCKLNNLKT